MAGARVLLSLHVGTVPEDRPPRPPDLRREAPTGADGGFAFEGLPPLGRMVFRVIDPRSGVILAEATTWAGGPENNRIVLRTGVEGTASVRGRVIDDRSWPVAGAVALIGGVEVIVPEAFVSDRGAKRWTTGHPWIYRSDVREHPDAPGIVAVRDGRGRFLIPGLWDMHVHLTNAGELACQTLVANGITSVRDLGGEFDVIEWMRERIARGALIGPRIFCAGPFVDGLKPGVADRLVVESAEDGRAVVDLLKRRGVDFIKVHTAVPADAYFSLLAAAKESGLDVLGHLPHAVDPTEAIAAGHASVEHIVSLFEGPVVRAVRAGKTQIEAIAEFTDEKAAALARLMAERGAYFDPTLIAYWSRSFQWDLLAVPDPRERYVAASYREYWKQFRDLPDRPEVRKLLAQAFDRMLDQGVVALAEAAGPVALAVELGCAQRARAVARGTHGVIDFLAGFLDPGGVGVERGQLGKRLDALEGRFLGGFAGGVRLMLFLDAQHQLNDQKNRQQGREQPDKNGNDDFLRGGLGHLGVRIGHEKFLRGVASKAGIIRKATPTGKGGGPDGWTPFCKPAMLPPPRSRQTPCARSSAG